jgi:hypothetical protein
VAAAAPEIGAQCSESVAQQMHAAAASPSSDSLVAEASHQLLAQQQRQQHLPEHSSCVVAQQLLPGHSMPSLAAAAAAATVAAAVVVEASSDTESEPAAEDDSEQPATAVAAVAQSPAKVTSSCQARSRLLAYACAADGAQRCSAATPSSCTTALSSTAQQPCSAAGCVASNKRWGCLMRVNCSFRAEAQLSEGPSKSLQCSSSSRSRQQATACWGAASLESSAPATQLIKPLLLKPM